MKPYLTPLEICIWGLVLLMVTALVIAMHNESLNPCTAYGPVHVVSWLHMEAEGLQPVPIYGRDCIARQNDNDKEKGKKQQ